MHVYRQIRCDKTEFYAIITLILQSSGFASLRSHSPAPETVSSFALKIVINWFFPSFQHAMLHLEIHHPFRPIIYIRYFFLQPLCVLLLPLPFSRNPSWPPTESNRYSNEWKINLRHFMVNLLTHFSFFHFTSFHTVYDFSIPLRHFQLIKKYVFQKHGSLFDLPFFFLISLESWAGEGVLLGNRGG